MDEKEVLLEDIVEPATDQNTIRELQYHFDGYGRMIRVNEEYAKAVSLGINIYDKLKDIDEIIHTIEELHKIEYTDDTRMMEEHKQTLIEMRYKIDSLLETVELFKSEIYREEKEK